MVYKVIITPPAKRRLDLYIAYTLVSLKNRRAAKEIRNDARATKRRLSRVATSIKICDNPILAKHGYRKLRFKKHAFVMIYRIVEETVIVDGLFHELQDYEAIFVNEMELM